MIWYQLESQVAAASLSAVPRSSRFTRPPQAGAAPLTDSRPARATARLRTKRPATRTAGLIRRPAGRARTAVALTAPSPQAATLELDPSSAALELVNIALRDSHNGKR